jgi:orotate phosphoribosyltransferase
MSGEQEDQVIRIFRKVGAVYTNDHFVYTSDKHGSAHIESGLVCVHPKEASYLGRLLAYQFCGHNIAAVVGPANGAIIPAQWMAHHLGIYTTKDVIALCAEKTEGGRSFWIPPAYQKLISGTRVFVVDDVLTTGRSLRQTVGVVRSAGGIVVGAGALWNRGGVTAEDIDVPILYSLVNIVMDRWDEADCTLCKEGKPINTDVGHGREFVARKAAIAE